MRLIHLSLAAIVVASSLCSCSMMSASGRQQAAYSRYVRHNALARQKQSVKYHKPQKIESQVSDAVVAAESGPQSASGTASEQ